MIYLDNAATTRPHEYVVRDMLPYLYGEYGNPSAVYKHGRKAADAVEGARAKVAKFLRTTPEHIVFTSGGSEGNNMVLRGLTGYLKSTGRQTIVTAPTEHPSVLRTLTSLIKDGFDIRFLPITTQGIVDMSEFDNYIQGDVGLVSVMYVNNETGAVNPVKEIAARCHERGILLHSDCVQAVAAFDVDVTDLELDFATLSAHKIHGPKGVGAVYIRHPKLHLIDPLIIGGEEQEGGLRGGTENVPGIVGFGTACDLMEEPLNFRTLFLYELSEALKKQGSKHRVYVNSSDNAVGNILNIEIEGIDAETLILAMDQYDVCLSAGSACHSKSVEPSHVLKAMGLSDEEARSSLRISASSDQTEQDIIDAAHIMAICIDKLDRIEAYIAIKGES